MSRLEDALRRAGRGVTTPETINVPSARALDWFADETTPTVGRVLSDPANAVTVGRVLSDPAMVAKEAFRVDVLPVHATKERLAPPPPRPASEPKTVRSTAADERPAAARPQMPVGHRTPRSEERRVGKEGRSRWS